MEKFSKHISQSKILLRKFASISTNKFKFICADLNMIYKNYTHPVICKNKLVYLKMHFQQLLIRVL